MLLSEYRYSIAKKQTARTLQKSVKDFWRKTFLAIRSSW